MKLSMTVYRFLNPRISGVSPGEHFLLSDIEQVKQIQKVLRLNKLDSLELIDGEGTLYICQITKLEKNSVTIKILETVQDAQEKSLKVNVALPLLKSDRFEFALQKLTELGISTISPIITERSVVRLREKDKDNFSGSKKYKRWMSITREATEQSERFRPPVIEHPVKLEHFLISARQKKLDEAWKFICVARSKAPSLVDFLLKRTAEKISSASLVTPPDQIQIIIGPEGGFTEKEIVEAEAASYVSCNLGKSILRSETAAIAAGTIAVNLGEIL